MDELDRMRCLLKVVDQGTISAAAEALGISVGAVSQTLAKIEADLRGRVLVRSRRGVSLTELGDAYVSEARTITQLADQARETARDRSARITGVVRLRVSELFATVQLTKLLPSFAIEHPGVHIDFRMSSSHIGPQEDDDLALVFATTLDGDFVARRLATSSMVLCASPEFLDRHRRPGHPSEIPPESVIASSQRNGIELFHGHQDDGDALQESFRLHANFRPAMTTDLAAMRYALALQGAGIAALPSFVLEDALLEGALEQVCPAWRAPMASLWACYPSARYLPRRVRVLADFLLERFGGGAHDPWLPRNAEAR